MKTAMDAFTPHPSSSEGVLVDPGWLHAHLADPRVRVVEVDVSRAAYDDWHIDGAVLWNVYADLKDADYRLADTAALDRLVARSGIGPESTVVFYGYAPAVGLWLMKLYGHRDVRILDCSRATWRAGGYSWSSAAAEPPTGGFRLGRAKVGH
jgi:thiosulfate/3-mercaptopyruvate sulfurtransferase